MYAYATIYIVQYVRARRVLTYLLVLISTLTLLPMVSAVGRETPKLTLHDYFLPGVVRWDAIPYHDFRRIWWIALCAALGTINQEGWSLLQTARDQDLGAPGNPGTPAQGVQSQNRNQRLFGAILNYIEANSYLYRFVSRTFANDGRGLFNYLYVYGHLPYTPEETQKMEHEWNDMTMHGVGIAYTPDAVFRWADHVRELGEKLGKSYAQMRTKYLSGFPNSFEVMVVPERTRPGVGTYIFPALYPAHHPQAGAAHPNAGEPDLDQIAHAFYPEWSRMLSAGLIRRVPRGMANQVRTDSRAHNGTPHHKPKFQKFQHAHGTSGYRSTCSDHTASDEEDEHIMMARARTSSRMICGICGGIGHPGKVDGFGQCMTARLGHRVPSADLSAIKYPEGYTPPTFLHTKNNTRTSFKQKQARVIEPDTSDSEGDEFEASQASSSKSKFTPRRKHYSPRPRRFDKTTFKTRPRARASQDDDASPPSQENPQSSDPNAANNESGDEQAQLAVELTHVSFAN